MSKQEEQNLLARADDYAAHYLAQSEDRPVFPDAQALAGLAQFNESLPDQMSDPDQTLDLLNKVGGPATVVSNGPDYYGFVIGANLPVAAAAERLVLAWDQCASSFVNSPAAATIEVQAGAFVLEALDLPRQAVVAFGTSATACGLTCIVAARRALLARVGWDFDREGLVGAPEIKVVVSQNVHITLRKIFRILGFGTRNLIEAPVDQWGCIDPVQLPPLDERTILCLQAGEVHSGEFDPFVPLMAAAQKAGAWVHVDGAFGLWARAAPAKRHLTQGIELADSWTADGHKWLNTPYDSAMAICRRPMDLSGAMNSDAAYATGEPLAQKNLTTEFSRRARGIAVWAVLRTLGREGLAQMVDRHCRQAQMLATGLRAEGVEILNRVPINQVLGRLESDGGTRKFMATCQESGEIWFGPGLWQGRAAFRLSVSSWRTTDAHIEKALEVMGRALRR